MIEVISLRQSYEQQEITKMEWIYGYHNLVDSITKIKLPSALKMLINTNPMNISIIEWVEQANIKQANTKI